MKTDSTTIELGARFGAWLLILCGGIWTFFYWQLYESFMQGAPKMAERKLDGILIGLTLILLGGMSRIVAAIEARPKPV